MILIIMLLSSAAVILLFPHKPAGRRKTKEKLRGGGPAADAKENFAAVKHGFERQVSDLREELERTNDEYQLLHDQMEKELGVMRRHEEESRREIQRLKGWGDKEKNELDKLRKDNSSLQTRFLQTQKDAEKEFSSNLALRRDLQDKEKQVRELSLKNKELSDKLRESESRESFLKKVSSEQENELADHRRRAAESEWISKAEHARVLSLLEEKTKELNKLRTVQE